MKSQITNELLKQAVADAEAVRETAIANAKLALEESITPAIKSMLQKRLMGLAAAELSATDSPTDSPDGTKVALENEPPADSAEQKDEDLDSSNIGAGDNKDGEGFDSSEIGDEGEEAPEDAADSDDDYYDDWDDSDFNLDEILQELEIGLGEDSLVEADDTDEEDADEDADEEEVKEASFEAGAAHPEGKKDAPKNLPPKEDEEDEEKKDTKHTKLDLEAFIRELVAEMTDDDEDEDGEDEPKEAPTGDNPEDAKKKDEQIASLTSELAEYREAVTLLRDKLQEVHLLNAKLLYTNKLFQKGKLTNEQAVRVLDSFDRAKTLREVKMVYALMVENIKAVRTEGRVPSRKRVVTEGLASRPTPSTAPKKEQLEENTHIKRLQYLAGINS